MPAVAAFVATARRSFLRARPALRGWLLLAALLVPTAAGAAGARPEVAADAAEGDELGEYEVKAAFLYNLIGYTTWPADAFERKDSPIRLVVLGQDPFGDALEDVFRGKRLHGRVVAIHRQRAVPERIDAHVVFCGALSARERADALARAAARPILVVGEVPGFAEDGATVNLRLESRKLRFEVNTEELKRAGLSMSSQVLKLAKLVKTRKPR